MPRIPVPDDSTSQPNAAQCALPAAPAAAAAMTAPTATARLVYSVREAATLLGVGKDYLYQRINSGEIPIVQLGSDSKSMRRIALTDLNAFIAARTEHAPC